MFGQLLEGAVIKNVTLAFTVSVGTSGSPIGNSKNLSVAGIAIDNYGTISNVNLSGNINTYSQKAVYFGGVVLNNYGIIESGVNNITTNINCSPTDATLSGARLYAAGITYENRGIIDGCSLSGSIDLTSIRAKVRQAAGIAVANRGLILNSEFTGNLTAFDMAGIAYTNEYLANTFTITKKYTEDIEETSYTYSAGTIIGCYAKGKIALATTQVVAGDHIYIGGLVAKNNGGFIGRCYSLMNDGQLDFYSVKASDKYVYTGGLVAFNSYRQIDTVYYAPRIENSFAIVNTIFRDSANRIESGAVIGGFAQTIGLSFTYGDDYGLANVVYYSVSSSAFGASTSITIVDTAIVEKVANSTSIADETHKAKLNNVSDSEMYAHVRVFYIDGSELSLRLEKTIEN